MRTPQAHFMVIFGAYELEVTIHSFNALNSSYQSVSNTRDYLIFLCVRPANTALSNTSESNQEGCVGNESTDVGQNSTTIPNAFVFTGSNWVRGCTLQWSSSIVSTIAI